MSFFALLTKELRLRLRRERTIWVIIVYILLMGLLGWFSVNGSNNANNYYNSTGLSNIGLSLYYLLSLLQLFLIVFITPAFTATAVNGEKERQTFDLLLCSRLSAFALVSGKLLAGLANALLLIAASAPLFSLVFFFGGVTPGQVLSALLVYVVTVIMLGTFGMMCSTLFQRPAVSTAITYMFSLLWIAVPLIVTFIMFNSGGGRFFQLYPNRSRLLFLWNPMTALASTYPPGGNIIPYYGLGYYGLGYVLGYGINAPYEWGSWRIAPWVAYNLLSIAATIVFFVLSMWFVKPNPFYRLLVLREKIMKSTTSVRSGKVIVEKAEGMGTT